MFITDGSLKHQLIFISLAPLHLISRFEATKSFTSLSYVLTLHPEHRYIKLNSLRLEIGRRIDFCPRISKQVFEEGPSMLQSSFSARLRKSAFLSLTSKLARFGFNSKVYSRLAIRAAKYLSMNPYGTKVKNKKAEKSKI